MGITVKIDKFGKIFVPKTIRNKMVSDEFEVEIEKDVLKLIPVKHPLELFGTLKSVKFKKLDEIHGEDHEFND
jgi:bifunctional DNA-binding transcriptional regulator/antitoxin component of YhaV-PrlF toxin-antitoxin module